MVALAFLVGYSLLRRELSRVHLDPELANSFVLAAMVGGIAGAKVYYLIEEWPDFLRDPIGMTFSGAGLTFYGGLFGGLVAVSMVLWRGRVSFFRVADIMGPVLLLGYGIGRVGCFLAGDGDYGPPSNLPWAMAFPNGVIPTDVRVHPTPLYETALSLLGVAILWRLRRKPWPPGTHFCLYFIAAGLERFIAEFWRITPKIAFGWMSMAQIISLALMVLGAAGWAWLRRGHSPDAI